MNHKNEGAIFVVSPHIFSLSHEGCNKTSSSCIRAAGTIQPYLLKTIPKAQGTGLFFYKFLNCISHYHSLTTLYMQIMFLCLLPSSQNEQFIICIHLVHIYIYIF